MPADSSTPAPDTRARSRRRLKILLAANAVIGGLFLFSQLDPSTVDQLGPVAQFVFDVLKSPGAPKPISPSGERLKSMIRALGGQADFMDRTHRLFGLLGSTELFHIRLNQTELNDEALRDLVRTYGDQIWGLDIRNTRVTDQGLRHLEGLTQIKQLTLGNDDPIHGPTAISQFGVGVLELPQKRARSRTSPSTTVPSSPITDAGLVHLKGLTQLMSLHLSGVPITDSGLDVLSGLPQLGALYLDRTQVKGHRLGRLKSLPRLAIVCLDDSAITNQGLSYLAGATNLQFFSVKRAAITARGLDALAGLARLSQVDCTGCALSGDDIHRIHHFVIPGLRMMSQE